MTIRSVHLLKKCKTLHSTPSLPIVQLVVQKYVTLCYMFIRVMYEDKVYKLTEESFQFRVHSRLLSFTEEHEINDDVSCTIT